MYKDQRATAATVLLSTIIVTSTRQKRKVSVETVREDTCNKKNTLWLVHCILWSVKVPNEGVENIRILYSVRQMEDALFHHMNYSNMHIPREYILNRFKLMVATIFNTLTVYIVHCYKLCVHLRSLEGLQFIET